MSGGSKKAQADRAVDRAEESIARAHKKIERAQERLEKERDRLEDGLVWLREEPGGRRPGHSRAEIAAAAVAIADEDGFDAVSMRRVSARLGAGTMTLYHYVRNKDELVTLMVDEIFKEILVPDEELAEGWRPALTQIAARTRAAFERHRWIFDRFGDGRPGPNGILHFEQTLRAVAGLEVSDYVKFELISQVDDYVFGYALREAQEFEEHERGWPPELLSFFQRVLDSGEYPLVREFLGDDVEAGITKIVDHMNRPGRFERGLGRLLDGIERELQAQAG
jgi:AcrR family transcriptional regulator